MDDWRPSQRAPATAGRSRPDTAAAQPTAPTAPLPPANRQANGHAPVNDVADRPQRPAADLLPAVTAPRGGGAIRGLDEKLAVDAATGTCATSVRIPFSPGRSGFTPALSLAYDSGAGNGPFGFGWSIGLPEIRRKTDKGLPRYCHGDESDVFILTGADDLVPALNADGTRTTLSRIVYGASYQIALYRPRVEGLFARIERWTDTASGDTHWRTISRDNVTTLYGADPASRTADPADPARVFSWRICAELGRQGQRRQLQLHRGRQRRRRHGRGVRGEPDHGDTGGAGLPDGHQVRERPAVLPRLHRRPAGRVPGRLDVPGRPRLR